MTDFENWARKPETKARLALSKKKCVGTIHKTVPERGQNPTPRPNKR